MAILLNNASMAVDGDIINASAQAVINNSTLSDKDKDEIKRLETTHPMYEQYKTEWEFYLAAYEGGTKMANEKMIFRHPREHEDDWRERVKRSHYHNYCERLVDFFTDFIYAETIDRNGGKGDDFFGEFIQDVDKKGEGIDDFMRVACDDMQIFGMLYILVDMPRIDPTDTPMSKLQVQARGIQPYWVTIRPAEILDWVVDDFERFIYVKRYQTVTEFDPTSMTKKTLVRFTEWTAEVIQITDVDLTEKSKPKITKHAPIANKLGEVPIEVLRYKRSKDDAFMGNSFLRDLAHNNREVLNLTSLEQEFLYKQCFNVMAMERDTNLTLAEQQDGEWGLSNVLFYPQGAKAPHYVVPDAKPAEFISKARDTCVHEMYKRAAQDMVNELFNGHKSSGFSKSMSFSTTVPYIASRADALEKCEGRLLTLTYKYMKQEWKGKIKYKDRYEITNMTDALAQMIQMFKDLGMPSETFAKHELKRIVNEFDGKIPYEDLQKINHEIDTMDFAEWSDMMKLALIGRAALSPEAALAFTDTTTDKGGSNVNTPASGTTPTKASPTTAAVAAKSTKQPSAASRK